MQPAMLQGIRPSQLHGSSKGNLSTSSAINRPAHPCWTDSDWQAMQESSNANNAVGQAQKGGVTKWKNKLKNFLTSPHPASKPLAPSYSQTSSNEDEQQDIRVGPSIASSSSNYSQQDFPISESYEARLSKLVGDLEDVDYGAAFQQFTNAEGEKNSHPYNFSASTPTTFADIQPPISIEDALSSFTTFGDYDFGDILVPKASETPNSQTDTGVSSAPLSAVQSTMSNASAQSASTTATSIARSLVTSNAGASRQSTTGHRSLYPGDAARAPVPFNSPVDGSELQETSIASLSMPFSFEDLRNMGLVEGGALDIGGGKEDDTFAELLRQSQVAGHLQEESTDSKDSTLDLGHFNLNLFPLPGLVPSPITDDGSGPSPALSYGESSTSNTSFEELLADVNNTTFRQSKSVQGLFETDSFRCKTPTHSPKPSLSSLPPTPSSHGVASSVPTTPHRMRPPPRVHASALAWRVAPTTLSPQSNIAVSPSRALHQMPSLSLSRQMASPSRLNRINTASSPELKRRRDDSDGMSTSIDARLGSQIGLRPVPASPARPIAGRRRVAGKMEAPHLRPSHSQHQLYQPSQPLLTSPVPQMPHPQPNSWLSEDIVRNLYTQLDARTYLCSLQGCHQTFGSDQQVRSHIQAHFAVPQAQVQQQVQQQSTLWV